MDGITGHFLLNGTLTWHLFGHRDSFDQLVGFRIQFALSKQLNLPDALHVLKRYLEKNPVIWLRQEGRTWVFDPATFRRNFQGDLDATGQKQSLPTKNIEWLQEPTNVVPTVEVDYHFKTAYYILRFDIFKEEYLMDTKTKIFLSHKGADKPLVLRFYATLQGLGFQPWLDQEDMPSGAELHRELRQGLADSCAVVFFITHNFRDESFLRNEVNWAIEEKTEKGGRFSIITLVVPHTDGSRGEVPSLLKSYVWKTPPTELDALQEIVRALPIKLGSPAWVR